MKKTHPHKKGHKIHTKKNKLFSLKFAFAALALFFVSFLLFANASKYQKANRPEIMLAESDFPTLCQDGMYDFCSQAPKCGEYPEINSAWEQKSAEIWNTYTNSIKEYCYTPETCYGNVPLCCYEMVRTKDKDKCWGIDTMNCLPSQCDQVPDSGSKNCGKHILYYCPERTGKTEAELKQMQPVPLSQRFPNDILFRLLDNNPQAHGRVQSDLPWLWSAYEIYKQGGSPTPIPPISSPTPTITPTQSPTPPPASCPTTSTNSYDTLSESLPSYPSGNPPADQHPDLNLSIRSYQTTSGELNFVNISGPTDPEKPPQLNTLFVNQTSVTFSSLYQVYDWDWPTNQRGNPLTDPAVTMVGISATAGTNLYPPFSDHNIGEDQPVATDPYQVFVLYADTNRITLKYDRTDSAKTGFTIHIEDICVDPNLLQKYNTLGLNDPSNRTSLIALRTRDPFGTANSSEVKAAIRVSGTFMDPRSKKDWWQDALYLPVDSPTPSPTSAPTPTPETPPQYSPTPSPTPTVSYFNNHFDIIGRVQTKNNPDEKWQSGNFCGAQYPVQNSPALNVSGYPLGKFLTGGDYLCTPAPAFDYDYYQEGNNEATGPITLDLNNLPPSYRCAGYSWVSADNPPDDPRVGSTCQVTDDLRYIEPYFNTSTGRYAHNITFFIEAENAGDTPTPAVTSGYATPIQSYYPTRTPTPFQPTPIITIIPVTIPAMGIKLGDFNINPVQTLSDWFSVLLQIVIPPRRTPQSALPAYKYTSQVALLLSHETTWKVTEWAPSR